MERTGDVSKPFEESGMKAKSRLMRKFLQILLVPQSTDTQSLARDKS